MTSDFIPIAELRGLIGRADGALMGMTAAAVRDPATMPFLADWYEEHAHPEAASVARDGCPVASLLKYLEGETGRRVRFSALHVILGS